MPWHTVLEFLLHTTTKIGAVFMENTTTSPDVLERFLRYVQINTQSEDANCDQVSLTLPTCWLKSCASLVRKMPT